MFNVGWFTVAAGLMRAGEDMDEPIRCPVPGLPDRDGDRAHPDRHRAPPRGGRRSGRVLRASDGLGLFALEQDQSIADQVDLTTITKVVLTHLHWDHAGGLPLIPEAVPVVVQRAEWTAGHDDDAVERNFYLPARLRRQRPADRTRRRRPRPARRRLDSPAAHSGPHAGTPVRPDRRAGPRRRRGSFRGGPGRPPLPAFRRRPRRTGSVRRTAQGAPRRGTHRLARSRPRGPAARSGYRLSALSSRTAGSTP